VLFGIVLSWYPAFTPDANVFNDLRVDQTPLVKDAASGEYLDYELGGYNPIVFGNAYDVVEYFGITGLKHEVNAETGEQISIRDRNDNKLTFEDDGVVSTTGRRVNFERDAQGRIIAVEDPRGNKVRYRYDANGNLADVTDRLGNVTQFTYRTDQPHYLDQVIDPFGRTGVKTAYNSQGRLSQLTDAQNQTITLSQDVANRTETITDQLGKPSTLTMDDRGNLTQSVDQNGKITQATFEPGTPFKTSETQVVGAPGGGDDITTTMTLNDKGLPLTQTDSAGNKTRITYNDLGLPETVSDPLGNTTYDDYDKKGNLTQTSSQASLPTKFTYDNHGNMLTIKNGPNATGNEYDAYSQPTATTGPDNVRHETDYDANGNTIATRFTWVNPNNSNDTRLVQSTSIYDEADQMVESIDPEGNHTKSEYDILNRAVKSWDMFNQESDTVYDSRGGVVESVSPLGTVTQTVYDAAGRTSWTVDDHLPGQPAHGTHTIYDDAGHARFVERWDNVQIDIVTNADGSQNSVLMGQGTKLSSTETQYDDAGRVTTSINAAGQPTTFEYDQRGLQTAVISALNQRSETQYDAARREIINKDALGQQTRTTYDGASRPVKVTFADGSFVTTTYDNRGRKIAETDQLGLTTNYEYDNQGRLTAVVLPQTLDPQTSTLMRPRYEYQYDQYGNNILIRDPIDARDGTHLRETTFTYDQFNRQLSRTLPGGATETWQYNTLGQLTQHLDFKGQKETSSYDSRGRLQGKQWLAVGSQTPGDSVGYHYDSLGRMDSYTDSRGTTSYSFNLDGRATQIASPEGTLNYSFNPATGQHTRTWTAYSDIGYGYDQLGRLETVNVSKRDGVTLGALEVTTYQYNAVGAVEHVTHGNGVTTDNSYDSLNRLQDVTHKTSVGAVIADYVYTRLPDGKISRVVESDAGGQVSQTDYQYDVLGRLKQEAYNRVAAGSDYTIDYKLDLVGNRLEKKTTQESGSIQLVNSAFNLRDWLLTEETRNDGVLTDTATYGYDANGSVTTRTTTSGDSATDGWDLRNRMAGASVATGGQTNTSSYVYDDSGIEVRRTQNGTTRLLIVDANNPTGYAQVIEELQSGLLVASNVYGLEPLSQSQNGQVSHYLMDGHSGVRQLLGASGAVLNQYRYDAFGALLAQTGNAVNPILYRGERFDPVLGQYYLRARSYNAVTGRFVSLDPFVGNAIDPLTFHKYLYATGDPSNNVDPSGMIRIGPGIGRLIAAVGVDLAMRILVGMAVGNVLGDAYKSEVNRLQVDVNLAIGRVGDPDLPATGYEPAFRRRPDILDRRLKTVHEIKSEATIPLGYGQVDDYIKILLRRFPGVVYTKGTWNPRNNPYTVRRIPGVAGAPIVTVYAWNAGGGVIGYWCPQAEWLAAVVYVSILIAQTAPARSAEFNGRFATACLFLALGFL
jgi:large repetitive protein